MTTNYEPDIDVLQRFKAAAEVVGSSSSAYPNLLRAYETTQDAVSRARSHLASAGLEPCVDVLGLGSVGRFEMSQESDLDYLLVCHSDDEHDHAVALQAADGLRAVVIPGVELKEPGSTGLFGKWLRDEDLYEVIGLEEDKNSTHSRRALVLEESVSLLAPQLHEELMRTMVTRYVDAIPLGHSSVPRFLVNDLARYWRQLTVDYQAKSESGSPSTLRRLKLIGPRKFTYASSMLPLLTLELRELDKAGIIKRLVEVFRTPPTLRFLSELAYLRENDPASAAVEHGLTALAAVDEFNGLLADAGWREKVQQVSTREEAEALDEFQQARQLARTLQGALDALFFSPQLEVLTRKYLVF